MRTRDVTTEDVAVIDLSHAAAKNEILETAYRNTFVYAVPRHCLNSRLRYNPYDIATISHVSYRGRLRVEHSSSMLTLLCLVCIDTITIPKTSLFDATRQQQAHAKYDYYTISRSGFTFYPLNDPDSCWFLPTIEWETQRQLFEIIARKTTFELQVLRRYAVDRASC